MITVVINGPANCGKTTIANCLKEALLRSEPILSNVHSVEVKQGFSRKQADALLNDYRSGISPDVLIFDGLTDK